MDPPKFFFTFFETLTNVDNTLVDTYLPVPVYGVIYALPATDPGPPYTPESLTHIDCYIYDVISVVQGGAKRQHQLFDSAVRALKWILPSLQGEAKDLVSVKKLLAREGGWSCVKEVHGWIVDTEAGTVALPECKLQGVRNLLAIPTTQQKMGRKDLELLVGKLLFMHLAMPGVVAHLYHHQRALSQAGADRAWLSPEFHREIADWRNLADQTAARTTHLEDIDYCERTHMGFCNILGLGAGGV